MRVHGWLKWNYDTQKYEVIEEKANSIRRIFEIAGKGFGIRLVTLKAIEENLPLASSAKISKRWSTSNVGRILKCKSVLGFNTKLNVLMYPPIIDEKLFYKVQAQIDNRKRYKWCGRTTNTKNLFTGIGKCSVCGLAMSYHNRPAYLNMMSKGFGSRGGVGARGGKSNYTTLHCSGLGYGTCTQYSISYEWVEDSFLGLLGRKSFITAYVDQSSPVSNNMEVLKGKLADTRKKLEKFTSDYEKQPSNSLLGLMAKTETEEKNILREIEQEVTVNIGTSSVSDSLKELHMAAIENIVENLENPEFRIKLRDLIRSVFSKIVINIKDKSYDVYYRNNLKPIHVQCFKNACIIDGERFVWGEKNKNDPDYVGNKK